MRIVHHHLIYQASVSREDLGSDAKSRLEKFLYDTIDEIGMECLIPAQLAYSKHNAWTGLVGIVTSHIAFHYWIQEKEVQVDIYSCKPFDRERAKEYLDEFWRATESKVLFIDREIGKGYDIQRDDSC